MDFFCHIELSFFVLFRLYSGGLSNGLGPPVDVMQIQSKLCLHDQRSNVLLENERYQLCLIYVI